MIAIHGLGGTKGSFLPTVAELAPHYRVIAADLPGFGDSSKPLRGAYDPAYFARAIVALMDELGLERAHFVGNSLGGRVAIELGISHPRRVGRLVMLCPALAWRRERPLVPLMRLTRPEWGLVPSPLARWWRRSCDGSSPVRSEAGRRPGWTSSCAPT